MRSCILLFCFLMAFTYSRGQQHTNYTQYTFNRFALNPAIAGIKRCSETTIGHRRQWMGFQNAPRVFLGTFHTRINKDDKYPKNFHGFGFQIMNDQSGITNNTYFKAAYAYHLKIWTNYHLSFGIYGGFQSYIHSYNSITIPQKGLDPAINDEAQRAFVVPEVSPGMFLYNRNMFLSLSMTQLYPAKYKIIGTDEFRLSSHYFLSSGYRFRGYKLDVVPSFMMSFAPFASPTMDINLSFDYDNILIFGLGSKYLNSGYASLQLQISNVIGIAYAYEYALNEISRVAPVTHEIMIKFSNCTTEKKRQDFICPAYD